MVFTDIKGSVIKSINLNSRRKGQLAVSNSTLSPGTYTYTLNQCTNRWPRVIQKKRWCPLTSFLVLKSVTFFEKEKIRMDGHDPVHLNPDRYFAGVKCTRAA